MYKLIILLLMVLVASCGNDNEAIDKRQETIRKYSEDLLKIPEYTELMKTVETVDTFNGFPPIEIWKILIDGRQQGFGPLVFDKEEPGYLAGVSRALDQALKQKSSPISVELLEEFRKYATTGVTKIPETTEASTTNSTATTSKPIFRPQIGGSSVMFSLVLGSNATVTGIADLRDKLSGQKLVKIETDKDGKLKLVRSSITREKLYPLVEKIIATYEASKKTIKDIVIMCQDLDQLHPFNDGNIRTFGIVLFQKELARTGQTPAILENPNRFDAYSVSEMMEEIAKGQETFRSLVILQSPIGY